MICRARRQFRTYNDSIIRSNARISQAVRDSVSSSFCRPLVLDSSRNDEVGDIFGLSAFGFKLAYPFGLRIMLGFCGRGPLPLRPRVRPPKSTQTRLLSQQIHFLNGKARGEAKRKKLYFHLLRRVRRMRKRLLCDLESVRRHLEGRTDLLPSRRLMGEEALWLIGDDLAALDQAAQKATEPLETGTTSGRESK